VAISAPAMEPASFTLPVKMKLNTNVSTLPVILQVIALAMDRGWESRMRTNIGASTLQNEASCLSYRPILTFSPQPSIVSANARANRTASATASVLSSCALFGAALLFRTVTSIMSVLPPTSCSRQLILARTWSSSSGCNSMATPLLMIRPVTILGFRPNMVASSFEQRYLEARRIHFRRFVASSIKITGCWAIVGA
jgi:hypothetical protein